MYGTLNRKAEILQSLAREMRNQIELALEEQVLSPEIAEQTIGGVDHLCRELSMLRTTCQRRLLVEQINKKIAP